MDTERTFQAEGAGSMNTPGINNDGEHSTVLPEFKFYLTLAPQFLTYILSLAPSFPSISSSFIRPYPTGSFSSAPFLMLLILRALSLD